MFEVAVLGPIATGGLGVIHECVACFAARPRNERGSCSGFDVGCLGFRAAALVPSERPTRLAPEFMKAAAQP